MDKVGEPSLVLELEDEIDEPTTALDKVGEPHDEVGAEPVGVDVPTQHPVMDTGPGAEPEIAQEQRHSERPTAGQHTNPFHLPKSTVSKEVVVANTPPPSVDSSVLANISQTQLLMVQLMMGKSHAHT